MCRAETVPGQCVVETESLGCFLRQDHLAGRDSQPDLCADGRGRVGGYSVPPSNVSSTSPRDGRPRVTTASKRLPSPTASRSHVKSGRLIRLSQRATRNGPALVQDQQVRRKPDDVVEIMGDEDQRNVERSTQLIDLVLKVPADGSVDSRERLVQEQDRRLARQRTGQRDPLTLAARQRVRPAIHLSGQVHQRQQLLGLRAAFAPRAVAKRGDRRCRRRSSGGTARTPERRTRPRGDARGAKSPDAVSVHTSLPERMLACSGRYSPAMLRSTVVLPLPDGPKIARTSPASQANRDIDRNGAALHGA